MELAIPKHIITSIPDRGRVHIPTKDDLESGIIASMVSKLKAEGPLLRAGHHRVVALDSPLPHHFDPDQQHTVMWIYNRDKQEPFEISPWNDYSWYEVAGDREFLVALDKKMDEMQNTTSSLPLRVYFFIGFVPPGEECSNIVYSRGLQTQMRMHVHVVSPIPENHSYNQILELGSTGDRYSYTQMINEARERSSDYFRTELNDFGTPITYHQVLGRNGNPALLRHNMYGFSTLEDALGQCLSLREKVKNGWVAHTQAIYGVKRDEITGLDLEIMQSHVPNFGIIKPSFIDRQNGKTNDNFRYWVVPFSVSGGQCMLTPGGVHLTR